MTTPNPGVAPATPTSTPAPDGVTSPANPPATPTELAQPSKDEWVQNRKDQRALNDKLDRVLERLATPQSPPATPAAPGGTPPRNEPSAPTADAALAEVRELRRSLDVKDALLSAGVSDPAARRLIELAVRAANPSDIGAFVAEHAGGFAKAAPATAQPTTPNPVAPPASPGRTDTGAPGIRPDAPLPGTPNQIPVETWKAMSPEKRKEHLGNWLAQGGQTNWMQGRKPPKR